MSLGICNLPNEMLLKICRSLKNADLLNLSVSAKKLNPIAQDILYESMCINSYPNKAPYSHVLKTLLSRPELRCKVKSLSINLQSSDSSDSSDGRPAADLNLREDIKAAWFELGYFDANQDNNNRTIYQVWALRLFDCKGQVYAGVLLSLLPNLGRLDIVHHSPGTPYIGIPSNPAHELFGSIAGINAVASIGVGHCKIVSRLKLQELTLCFKGISFLNLGFPYLTDLNIRLIGNFNTVGFTNQIVPYHLPNLKNLTIEVFSQVGYAELAHKWRPNLRRLLNLLGNPVLESLVVDIRPSQLGVPAIEVPQAGVFDFQLLLDILHTACPDFIDLRINLKKNAAEFALQSRGLTTMINHRNLKRLSVPFAAFGAAKFKLKYITEIIPTCVQYIHLVGCSKDVLFWVNMLDSARVEYPNLRTVILDGDMEGQEWIRSALKLKVATFEEIGIRLHLVNG